MLTVTDAFTSGDRFELFDFGASIGLTSLPSAAAVVDCGDDPEVCLVTPGISTATFALANVAHSITLVPMLSAGGGAGYLRATVAAVPSRLAAARGVSSVVDVFAAAPASKAISRRRRHVVQEPPSAPAFPRLEEAFMQRILFAQHLRRQREEGVSRPSCKPLWQRLRSQHLYKARQQRNR